MSEELGKALPKLEADGAAVVAIKEENTETGRHYGSKSFEIDVPASTGIYTADHSVPHPISILAAGCKFTDAMDGDYAEFHAAPDAVIGAITQDVAVDDEWIFVQQSVIDNSYLGLYIELYKDGTTNQKMGRIVEVDEDNLKIKIETIATQTFAAADPTYVRMTRKIIDKTYLVGSANPTWGEEKLGGTYMPANITLRIVYNNISGTAKTLSVRVKYLY